MKKSNENDIDIIIDEALQTENAFSEQTKLNLEAFMPESIKQIAKNHLFGHAPKDGSLELIYDDNLPIKSSKNNSKNEIKQDNIEVEVKSEKKNEKPELTEAVTKNREEKRINEEFKKYDEEINYRKKLAKIMKKSTPTEPFAFNLVPDETFLIGEEEVEPLSNVNNEKNESNDKKSEDAFEYYINDEIGKFDKISVRVYENVKTPDTMPYLLINKLLFTTVMIIFGLYILEIGAFVIFMRSALKVNYLYYLILLFVALIPLGYGLFRYSLNPDLKVKKKINFSNIVLNSIILIVLAVVVLLIITLLTATSISEFSQVMPRIVIPFIMIANYPIGILVYYLLYKSETYFV